MFDWLNLLGLHWAVFPFNSDLYIPFGMKNKTQF